MSDGHIVTFKNGESVIMSDKFYRNSFSVKADWESVEKVVKYLDITAVIQDHPWLRVFE